MTPQKILTYYDGAPMDIYTEITVEDLLRIATEIEAAAKSMVIRERVGNDGLTRSMFPDGQLPWPEDENAAQ